MGGQMAELHLGSAACADHLNGLVFARQNGEAHHFLPVDHSLDGGVAILGVSRPRTSMNVQM